MGEENCLHHEGFNKRLEDNEETIERIDYKVVELEKHTALDSQRFTMLLENVSSALGNLSVCIGNMEKTNRSIETTLISMQHEIVKSREQTETLDEKVDGLNNKVDTKINDLNAQVYKINSENVFNIRLWVREHFIGVLVGGAVLTMFGTMAFGKFISGLLI